MRAIPTSASTVSRRARGAGHGTQRAPSSTRHIVDVGGDAAQPLWWALALGADLGGNATAIGASANVVVLGIAKKNGVEISFWQYTKYGLVVTAISVALAIPYLLLRYFA